jgi:proteasome lid subunit RPN8/RPN11
MSRRLLISESQWTEMREHVEACAPQEGCGLLAGLGETVQRVFLIANQAKSPTRFHMDAAEQLQAFRIIEKNNMDLLAIFHSHPAAPPAGFAGWAAPSPTDVAEAAYPVVQIIWSRPSASWRADGFWIEDGHVSSVRLQLGAGQ